jgi:ParB/RepB/Spo0J family partition protein
MDKFVKLKDITYDNKFNLRGPVSDRGLKELREDIKHKGLIQPLVVDQNMFLLAGYRRRRACELNKMTEVKVTVIHCRNDMHRRAINLGENENREPVPRYKVAKMTHDLYEDGMTYLEIGETFNKSSMWSRTHVALGSLPDYLLKETGKLKITDIYRMYKKYKDQKNEYEREVREMIAGKKKRKVKPTVKDIKRMKDEIKKVNGGWHCTYTKLLAWVLGDISKKEVMDEIKEEYKDKYK